MEHENFSDKSCRFGIISKIFAPSKKLLKIMEKIFIYDRYGLVKIETDESSEGGDVK